MLSLKSRFSKDWTAWLSDSASQCAYWDKDKIRLCLPSNATLASARLYRMQCVSFTLALSVGQGGFGSVQGGFGSVQGFLLLTKAAHEDKT